MGKINATNDLIFKSSKPLFDRVKKRLSSYDAQGLIDDGDFHKYVKDLLEELGRAVYKECETVVHIKDRKAKLPDNFKYFYAAYRCTFKWHGVKSINEQKPWIFYTDTEITQECPSECKLECKKEFGKTKIVIRTFVNGEESTCSSNNPRLLKLSSSVGDICTEDSPSLFCHSNDEIEIEDKKIIHTNFDEDSVYIQYYGLPVDEFGLPMIPDQVNIEKAIEYYIYTQLFQDFYWNSTVPDIARMLADVRQQYDFELGQARSWVKLPSFQTAINSIRRQRGNRKFYQFNFDRTVQ